MFAPFRCGVGATHGVSSRSAPPSENWPDRQGEKTYPMGAKTIVDVIL
jgi:hypothetical protein